MHGSGGILASHGAWVSQNRPHLRPLLSRDAFLDQLQGGLLDIQEIKAAATGRLENAELRFVAGIISSEAFVLLIVIIILI